MPKTGKQGWRNLGSGVTGARLGAGQEVLDKVGGVVVEFFDCGDGGEDVDVT